MSIYEFAFAFWATVFGLTIAIAVFGGVADAVWRRVQKRAAGRRFPARARAVLVASEPISRRFAEA